MINYISNDIRFSSVDTVCHHEACPVHHLCARYERYHELVAKEQAFAILNPRFLECSEEGCKHRLTKKTFRLARGFQRMFDTVPSGNTYKFWQRTPYYSESTYCRAKRGAIALAPEMQQELLQLLQKYGADISIGFDRYEEQVGYEEIS